MKLSFLYLALSAVTFVAAVPANNWDDHRYRRCPAPSTKVLWRTRTVTKTKHSPYVTTKTVVVPAYKPGKTVTVPVYKPGKTVTVPVYKPGKTVTVPVYKPDKTITITVPGEGSTLTLPGGTVTAPGDTVTVTVPGDTVTVPGETVTAPGETVTAPGETVTAPGETVTAPGDTVTVTNTGACEPSTVTVTTTATTTDSTPPACTNTSPVVNGGFEGPGQQPWVNVDSPGQSQGSAIAGTNNNPSNSGDRQFRFRIPGNSPPDEAFYTINQPLTLCVGATYNFQAFTRNPIAGSLCEATFSIGGTPIAVTSPAMSDAWVSVGGTYTATTATALLEITVRCPGTPEDNGAQRDLYLDDVSLTAV